MSLTKRLYRLDEVRAAFLFCIKQGFEQEAIFWLNELEESKFSGEARRLLFLAWCMFIGLQSMKWLQEWSLNGKSREGRRELCLKLCQNEKQDSSLWWLLWAGVVVKESEDTYLTKWRHYAQLDDGLFWCKIQNETDKSIDDKTKVILQAIQDDIKSYSWFAKVVAFSVCFIPLPKGTWNKQNHSISVKLLETNDTDAKNIRKERLYQPPVACHAGMTCRGSGFDTMQELNSLDLVHLKTSAYWKHCLVHFVNEEWDWNSDEDLESFWDTYFPWLSCNHPDEWSKADKEKSHGTLDTAFVNNSLETWWDIWIPKDRLLIWGDTYTTLKKFIQSTKSSSASIIDGLLQEYRYHYTHKECVESVSIVPKLKKRWICKD